MKAVLLSTEGAYLEAVIDINGKRYCVMDEVSSDDGRTPAVGKLFNVELYIPK